VLENQDSSQITGSKNNFAGFTDTHLVPKTTHGFITIYETSILQQSWPTLPSVKNPRWQPNYRKYYDIYHQNSNGKLTAFDHGKLVGSALRRFQ